MPGRPAAPSSPAPRRSAAPPTTRRSIRPSQRAAIDWRSFDVGSQQSVTFNQPSASAVALNRVTGPDPSQIAGRIDANGQIILVNQSGVNFYKGAQVNAAGVMVSAANITNQNFMAGVMKFDQPGSNPNAKIDNQGTITVKQAGLAALVAPQVANSGTISAKLGHVVLAGAKTATLDLFGDGLLSLDVTNQVTQAPVGPDGKAATALVTNTGVIVADGGTVQLTARAADGIVQNLVQAGGTIRAATMGDQTGVVALNGVGGSIVVEGQLSAPGTGTGHQGRRDRGRVEPAMSRSRPRARIDASGKAGGGVVAIGTTLASAKGGPGVTPTIGGAQRHRAEGATVCGRCHQSGNGGKVTVLSTDATRMDGLITVRGGAQGGDGGLAEVSGGVVSLTGKADAAAPLGTTGTLLLDPLDLFVSNVQPGGTFAILSGSDRDRGRLAGRRHVILDQSCRAASADRQYFPRDNQRSVRQQSDLADKRRSGPVAAGWPQHRRQPPGEHYGARNALPQIQYRQRSGQPGKHDDQCTFVGRSCVSVLDLKHRYHNQPARDIDQPLSVDHRGLRLPRLQCASSDPSGAWRDDRVRTRDQRIRPSNVDA